MPDAFNIYCDESCHLENDGQLAMVLGALWCPASKCREIATRLREIKARHGLASDLEVKWVKVSPAKLQFYLDVVDYFFDDDDLHFRALVVPNKTLLDHPAFDQTHDDWYYKMYFSLLKAILHPTARYRVYLDYKDTQGARKVERLHAVLSNSLYDFSRHIVERIQLVRSHETELLPLADLLIGAVAYANRGLATSEAKCRIVARLRERSGYSLTRSTLLREDKLNVFRWRAAEAHYE
ncbi:MAG: DUF3800 domain-containing protein [Armatimonadetes bacterium]|nr:DUF3800 domain-containing protein [Armatimonadota bacterium]